MDKEITRRDFIKALGAGLGAVSALGSCEALCETYSDTGCLTYFLPEKIKKSRKSPNIVSILPPFGKSSVGVEIEDFKFYLNGEFATSDYSMEPMFVSCPEPRKMAESIHVRGGYGHLSELEPGNYRIKATAKIDGVFSSTERAIKVIE